MSRGEAQRLCSLSSPSKRCAFSAMSVTRIHIVLRNSPSCIRWILPMLEALCAKMYKPLLSIISSTPT